MGECVAVEDMLSRSTAAGPSRGRPKAYPAPTVAMNFPDLSPWFDNESDEYEELAAGGNESPYDERAAESSGGAGRTAGWTDAGRPSRP
jgi:hypothetical protein